MPINLVSRLTRFGLLLAIPGFCLSPAPTRAADGWPSEVKALYDVTFNGLNVGSYAFNSTQQGHSYKLTSNAELSLLLGALHWTGATEASGQLTGETAKPQKFGFEYKAQSKVGSTHISFTDDTVTQVLHNPPAKIKDGVIPVQTQHLKGVLDPLSAILALSRGGPGNPCSRRIPIYDGTQRFDLVLSPKGQVALDDKHAGSQSSAGYVCRVRYVPIAGYKPDEGTNYLAHNNDIEVVLRPLPNANIFVPYKVTIPTMAGNATLTARRVNVVTSDLQRFAFIE